MTIRRDYQHILSNFVSISGLDGWKFCIKVDVGMYFSCIECYFFPMIVLDGFINEISSYGYRNDDFVCGGTWECEIYSKSDAVRLTRDLGSSITYKICEK